MRYSNTTLKELTARYKHVLLKCACLNAAIIAGTMIATPAMAIAVAAGTSGSLTENVSGAFSPNGGVANNNGTLTISDDLIFDKNSANNGGVIYSVNASNSEDVSTLNIGKNVQFNNNTASDSISEQAGANGAGGAIYVMGGAKPSTMTAGDNVSFSGNSADVKGGALFIEDGSVTFGDNAKFENNTAGKSGGAIYNWDYLGKTTELKFGKNATFSGNSAGTVGGAIVNYDGKITFGEGAKFENNTAGTNGGALANIEVDKTRTPTMIIKKDSLFTGNSANMGYGGAIYSRGDLTIAGTTFDSNSAYVGGAISSGYNSSGDKGNLIVADSTFTNNSAKAQGGAVVNYSTASITSSIFTGNKVTDAVVGDNKDLNTSIDGGGALFVGSSSSTNVSLSNFLANSSTTDGGAIATRQGWTKEGVFVPNTTASLDVEGSTFDGNMAGLKGGAIYNSFQETTIKDSAFTNNTAGQKGGAIYNNATSEILFQGANSFTNNFNAGTANDIFNDGTITNSYGAVLSLNSGLVNNGSFTNDGALNLNGITEINSVITNTGTITFGDGSYLKTSLWDSATMINGGGTLVGKTSLVIANGTDGSTLKIAGSFNDFSFNENVLYNIETDDSNAVKTSIISKKTVSEVADSLADQGVNNTHAATIVGMTEAKPTTAQGQAIADAITTAVQMDNVAGAKQLVDAVNPVSTPVVQTQAVGSAAQVMNVASGRMSSAGAGRSGGSLADFAYGPWIQGLYNKTHNSQGAGFDGYSQGFALGMDTDVTDSTMIGAAYAYTATDINSNGRKTKVYGDNYMIYGKYQPSEWYIDGSVNYGHGSYDENSLGLKSKYNVDTYGGQALVGYQTGIFDNYAGARYVYVNPEKYSNGLTEVNAKNSQVGTVIVGTKISKEYKNHGVVWKPEFRLAATYDAKSDNSSSNVSIVGGNTTYTVHGKRLSRGAIQPGLGLKATVNNLDVVLGYDAEFRSEQTSQTGTLKLQYNF